MIKYEDRSYGDEKIDKVIQMKPEDRIRSCGNLLNDKITGILYGFAQVLKSRGNHHDIITQKYATEEIKELLKEYKMYSSWLKG